MVGKKNTINAEIYVLQMHGLSLEIQQKLSDLRHGVLVQHDNAFPPRHSSDKNFKFLPRKTMICTLELWKNMLYNIFGHVVLLTGNHCSLQLPPGEVQKCFYKLCKSMKDQRFFKDLLDHKNDGISSPAKEFHLFVITSRKRSAYAPTELGNPVETNRSLCHDVCQ
ncbi:hypothetical protein T11_9930 [Trichinella zimbabwensis]|uniref:Uncharacterized protein n=1 Tax=Trichinella zimbabwensis TaxID=268475 RepID=A0A0V1HTB9_9BILA|nr:hypothetical protein T11_9930 [Trichinella zimbabwensis]